jgi:hypothetical protein
MRPLLMCDEDRDLYPLRRDPQRLKTLEQLNGIDREDTGEQSP